MATQACTTCALALNLPQGVEGDCTICGRDVAPECINCPIGCKGPVEYRMPLSGTGISYPRCEQHWQERLDQEQELRRRYPVTPPADWSPLDAGEAWDEDDY